MFRNTSSLILFALGVLLFALPAQGERKFFAAPPGQGAPGRYIVVISDGHAASKAPELLSSVGGGGIGGIYTHAFDGFTAKISEPRRWPWLIIPTSRGSTKIGTSSIRSATPICLNATTPTMTL